MKSKILLHSLPTIFQNVVEVGNWYLDHLNSNFSWKIGNLPHSIYSHQFASFHNPILLLFFLQKLDSFEAKKGHICFFYLLFFLGFALFISCFIIWIFCTYCLLSLPFSMFLHLLFVFHLLTQYISIQLFYQYISLQLIYSSFCRLDLFLCIKTMQSWH